MEYGTTSILQYWNDIRMLVRSRITIITNELVGGYSPLVEELSLGALRIIPLSQILLWRAAEFVELASCNNEAE
jgi:hypothetical protein